ncbi:MAG: Electron transfer flavoprotein beta subunit/FixA family protein [Bacteroidota bacterium]|nr:Electron transfer flavoprotein beta subunit/FixA family protein [Bacteroidota bacterium]
MNILVCVSRVPDTATRIIVGPDGKSIDNKGIKFVVNPYDEFAIEEGLRLREKNGGTVTAVTVGGDEAKEQLRTSLAMGVDKAVLIKSCEQKDSFAAANNIAEYAKELSPDIIFLGRQSVDYDSFQMASALGELLGLPSVSVVSKLTVENGKAIAERDIEGGKEIVEASLPCLISAQKGLNDPRYPKLPDIMKAKSKPIEERNPVSAEDRVTVLSMSIPSKQRANKIKGDTDSDIEEVVRLLHEEAKVI